MGKKWVYAFLFAIVLLGSLAACGNDDPNAKQAEQVNKNEGAVKNEDAESKTQAEEQSEEPAANTASTEPIEPTSEDTCAFCNMKIYEKDEEMGAHTAQAVTHDGEHVHFDDIGCLYNYERKTGEEYIASWVRDYQTKEWIAADEATPVSADIKTPMKFGIALFKSQADADNWVKAHPELNPAFTTMEAIDQTAKERMMKKMQMNKQN